MELSSRTFNPKSSVPFCSEESRTMLANCVKGCHCDRANEGCIPTLANFSMDPSLCSIFFSHSLALPCLLFSTSWNGESQGSSLTAPYRAVNAEVSDGMAQCKPANECVQRMAPAIPLVAGAISDLPRGSAAAVPLTAWLDAIMRAATAANKTSRDQGSGRQG